MNPSLEEHYIADVFIQFTPLLTILSHISVVFIYYTSIHSDLANFDIYFHS
jgi:hypothetical protein